MMAQRKLSSNRRQAQHKQKCKKSQHEKTTAAEAS